MTDPSDIGMPIGAVTQLTDISSHTLRKWESRYHAIEPLRTETGRRMYSSAQVDRLILLRDLVRRGHQISRLADMTDDALREFLGTARRPPDAVGLKQALVIGRALPTRLAARLNGRSAQLLEADASAWLADSSSLEAPEECALMVELPTISAADVSHLVRLRGMSFARVVAVYGFASQKTLRALMDAGIVCLKELRDARGTGSEPRAES